MQESIFLKDAYDEHGIFNSIENYLLLELSELDHIGISPISMDILLISEVYEFLKDKDRWLEVMFRHLNKIRESVSQHNYGIRLFGGLLELELVLEIVNRKTNHFHKPLNTLNSTIIDEITLFISNRVEKINSLEVSNYDLISGVTGVGNFMLNNGLFKDNEISNSIIKYYKKLCNKRNDKYCWFIEYQNQISTNEEMNTYRSGHYDCGMAHGIAGPLRILSELYLHGLIDDKYIINILEFYENIEETIDGIICWPGKVDNNFNSVYKSLNLSWCYGIIGISPSLIKAYTVLGDIQKSEILYTNYINLSKLLITNNNMKYFNTITICHGHSGLLCGLNQALMVTHDKNILKSIDMLRRHIINRINFLDNTGSLLEGKQGVLLSLLSTINPNTEFEQLLLLK